jgi:phenylpropionate dioxygenase-like ring-hydroxylating dioxygenase large terminal subunit
MSTPQYLAGVDLEGFAGRDAATLVDRVVDLYRTKSTDQADEQWREPVRHYLDPARWQREVEVVHRRVPLPLALSCELPGPGSYKAVEALDIPVLLTRDRTGAVHASVNACRHRGAELLPEGCGSTRRIVCPYHSWAYELSGELVGVNGERTFGPVDRTERSLLRLPVEERGGVVFVGLTPGHELDLDSWLGDAGPVLDSLRLDGCHHHSTRELRGPNWKVVLDGYLEGYHFASLHKTTVFRTNLSNMAAFDSWGPHQRNSFALRPIAEAAERDPADRDTATSVGPILFIFPGLAIAGGWRHQVAVSLVLPGRRVDESRTQQHIVLRHAPADEEELKEANHARDWFHDVVLDEDYATGEGVQRGLQALRDTEFIFGRNEPGVQHFHRTLHGLLASQ